MDEIWTTSISQVSPKQIIKSHRPGTGILGLMQISGDWLVFDEYQQYQDSDHLVYWYVRAYNLRSGESIDLASSTAQPGTLALPSPSVGGEIAVWNELVSPTQMVLKTYNLRTHATRVLSLPAASYPISPVTDGANVVFLDVATDPDRANEIWLSYGGRLTRYRLSDNTVQQLDSAPNAREPTLGGPWVLWQATDASGSGSLRISPLNGGPSRLLADRGVAASISASYITWWDIHRQHEVALSLGSTQAQTMTLPAPTISGSGLSLCGSTLFYAAGPNSINFERLPG
jgi:hypothetical protein